MRIWAGENARNLPHSIARHIPQAESVVSAQSQRVRPSVENATARRWLSKTAIVLPVATEQTFTWVFVPLSALHRHAINQFRKRPVTASYSQERSLPRETW